MELDCEYLNKFPSECEKLKKRLRMLKSTLRQFGETSKQ